MRQHLFLSALLVLLATPALLAQDACASAQAISGYGTFAWNNATATTDGMDHGTGSLCGFDGSGTIINDIWFCWQSVSAGAAVEVSDCPGSLINSKIAVYGPFASCATACVPETAELVACDDNVGCGGGLQSSVTFTTPLSGQAYLIRYGRSPNATSGNGSGTFTIGSSTIFADGFESGDTAAWSATQG